MSTILYHHIVFGPIHSRRLGSSLGVNLLPKDGKICSFDCIYCECGWNKDGKNDTRLPLKEEVFAALETRLRDLRQDGVPIDTITFSGNGEPTLHPDFPEIIDFTLKLRDELYPSAMVSVLSNGTQTGRKEIRDALMKVNNPILKLDGAIDSFVKVIDNPQQENYSVSRIIENFSRFNGDFILQTMFLRGVVNGKKIDSTEPMYVKAWVDMVLKMRPREVMMYTIDRETPNQELQKVSVDEMIKISEPLKEAGILVQVRG